MSPQEGNKKSWGFYYYEAILMGYLINSIFSIINQFFSLNIKCLPGQMFLIKFFPWGHGTGFYGVLIARKFAKLWHGLERSVFKFFQKFLCRVFSYAKRLTICLTNHASYIFSNFPPPYCVRLVQIKRKSEDKESEH